LKLWLSSYRLTHTRAASSYAGFLGHGTAKSGHQIHHTWPCHQDTSTALKRDNALSSGLLHIRRIARLQRRCQHVPARRHQNPALRLPHPQRSSGEEPNPELWRALHVSTFAVDVIVVMRRQLLSLRRTRPAPRGERLTITPSTPTVIMTMISGCAERNWMRRARFLCRIQSCLPYHSSRPQATKAMEPGRPAEVRNHPSIERSSEEIAGKARVPIFAICSTRVR
jgi:hypothetical protein